MEKERLLPGITVILLTPYQLALFSENILDSDKKGLPDSRESDCELGIEAHKSLADVKTKILINAKPYPMRLFFTGKTPKRN